MNNNKNQLLIALLFVLLLAQPCFALTDDEIISNTVNQDITENHDLDGSDVMVQTKDGMVYLTGHVQTEDQVLALYHMIENIDGVSDINIANLNIAASDNPIPDDMITAKINGAFMQMGLFGVDANFDDITVHVSTSDGVVTLSGYLDSESKISHAVAIAKLISGVKSVNSQIVVR